MLQILIAGRLRVGGAAAPRASCHFLLAGISLARRPHVGAPWHAHPPARSAPAPAAAPPAAPPPRPIGGPRRFAPRQHRRHLLGHCRVGAQQCDQPRFLRRQLLLVPSASLAPRLFKSDRNRSASLWRRFNHTLCAVLGNICTASAWVRYSPHRTWPPGQFQSTPPGRISCQ